MQRPFPFQQVPYFYDTDPDDVEAGRKARRNKRSAWRAMFWYLARQLRGTKLQPTSIFLIGLVLAFVLLVLIYIRVGGGVSSQYASDGSLKKNYPYAHLSNLVMVAGHAVYTSNKCAKADEESSWYLEPYQKHAGQASSFLEHIHKGVSAAAHDNQSLLLFSGGETRKEAGPRSEAQSYWTVADSHDWFGKAASVRNRALTEEHARDSFENLLFSVCRFRELTGRYPHNITVVSYNFKALRFVGLHRAALKFPADRFTYLGTIPAITSAEAAAQGEFKVQEQFRKDPYGCSAALRDKRLRRDPFLRLIPYPSGCPEIAHLFTHCGDSVLTRKVPWEEAV